MPLNATPENTHQNKFQSVCIVQKKPPTFVGGFFAKRLRRYLSKAKTLCGAWFACANMAVAACAMICERANSVVSLA